VEIQIHVENMTCHNCSKVLRNALEPASGITSVVIKKPQKNLFIHFDTDKITLNRIVEIINGKGYEAEILHAKKEPETQQDLLVSFGYYITIKCVLVKRKIIDIIILAVADVTRLILQQAATKESSEVIRQ
jgi:copper chaperone CopZ